MDFDNDGNLLFGADLGEWVSALCTKWRNHYRTKYENKHEEYYRIWRGQWNESDRVRDTERSKLIAPATAQAVESSVSEIEEACFGSGNWFDLEDDYADQERADIEQTRNKLMEDFKHCQIRKACLEVVCNAAVTGTGVGEILVESGKSMVPAVQQTDEDLAAYGVKISNRMYIKLNPIMEKNFLHDPAATTVDDGLGVAVEEDVGMHHILELQDNGIYLPIPVTGTAASEELSADNSVLGDSGETVRICRYYGKVPTELLKEYDPNLESDERYTEAIVVITSAGEVLKARKNPYMMCDRPVLSFQWDVVPGKLRGRGVVEKAYNSQKALDAEIRARVDALALTVHPMMAMDATRLPRGFRAEIKPGKVFLTQGNPNEIMAPFKLGEVSQITFAQAAALQDMVQQATGAIDSTGLLSNIDGAKTGAVSMSMAAIIKRHKRTIVNFQQGFLIPFIQKAAWRYMQFDPENYPAKDYKFTPVTSLGTIGREAETQQLVGLLQTMSDQSPLYNPLVESVIANTSLTNKEKILETLRAAQQPDPAEVKAQQQVQQMQLENQQAQTDYIKSQEKESLARAAKYDAEAKYVPIKSEADLIRSAMEDLQKDQEGKDFDRRLSILDRRLKKRELDIKNKEVEYGKAARDSAVETEANFMQSITGPSEPTE